MDSLRLIPEDGSEAIPLQGDLMVIGRDATCDIRLSDPSVSRQHAEIRRDGARWVVADLNSANGVVIDGTQIPRSMLLPGQRLQFGEVRFRVQLDGVPGSEGATVVMDRPVIKEGPKAARSRRPDPVRNTSPPRAAPAKRSGRAMNLLAIGIGLVALEVGLAIWLTSPSSPWPRRKATPLVTSPGISVSPPAEPAAPLASANDASPRGKVVVSTDTAVVVSIDGQRRTELAAGGIERIDVAPGEHIVSFDLNGRRLDQVVKVEANGQIVARFLKRNLKTAAAPSRADTPSRSPKAARATPAPPPPRRPATPPSTPQSTPPVIAKDVSPLPPPAFTDEGLSKGVDATTRGDFYRAVLLLKNAAERMEKPPEDPRQQAWAYAYLAWAYYGLDRTADARSAADSARRADPGIVSRLAVLPSPVASLFK